MTNQYHNQGGQQTDQNHQSFTPQRPENVPEKFWDAESGQVRTDAVLEAYSNLEKRLSTGAHKQDAAASEGGDKPNTPQIPTKQDQAATFDWDGLTASIEETGSVTEDQMGQLEALGVPKQIVENYINLIGAQSEFSKMRTAQYAGGQEALDSLLAKAGQELSAEEIDSYNAMLSSPQWQVAIDGLRAKLGMAAGAQPDPNQGDLFGGMAPGGFSQGDVVFQNKVEMAGAINARDDQGRRLYDIDPQYRDQVRRRLVLSKQAGTV